MNASATIVWLRRDLRLADQPALAWAARRGGPVVPVFVWAPDEESPWAPGAAQRWWLHRNLAALAADLEALGSRLILRHGPTAAALIDVARAVGADAVAYARRLEPAARTQDREVAAALDAAGIEAKHFGANTLWPPERPRTQSGTHYEVFTPYWKSCMKLTPPPEPEPAPERLPAPWAWPDGVALDALGLDPEHPWTAPLAAAWTPGEAGAAAELARFLDGPVDRYADGRNRPDFNDTSRLSPYLAVGAISAREAWHAAAAAAAVGPAVSAGAEAFQRELGWREFAGHLLVHRPETPDRELRDGWRAFPWEDDPEALRAWQRGRTGFKFVDAGMCQLWRTGWMHNRVRMVVASFLIKDLRLDWRLGAAWFWDTLIDADLASNTLGWQWAAGCGADAAPFFRVFNPSTQAERFDPDRAYRTRWLGDRDPVAPIVDHKAAREAALEAYEFVKAARA